ncbi:MAG: biopolymer transporter ExbD [Steroidobacteraceae bacterium]
MRQWPHRIRKAARIEIIPMIDVMMFLLVFFVLISINALPALGLRVALPFAANAEHLELPRRVTLTLTADGDLYLDGEKISLDDLGARLTDMTQGARLTVIIAGDRNAHLQALVSVLDVVKHAGIGTVSVIAKQP